MKTLREVFVQEIFGVNKHIREVAEGYAAKGYTTFAPAIFDEREKLSSDTNQKDSIRG